MAKRKYGVFGPFEIPMHAGTRVVDRKQLRDFWEEKVGKNNPGLPDASGCYIFGIHAKAGVAPWYVGQAKKTFRGECFTDHKRQRYSEALVKKKGTPILLLLARQTSRGKFATELKNSEANLLENMLIQNCLRANREMLNISNTSFFKEAEIPGLLNSPRGAPSKSTEFLRCLLKLG